MKRIGNYLFGFALLILPVVSAVSEADTPAICLIGDHPGISDSDAQTAALLVCDELHKQGISITDPVYEAPDTANVYRVVFRRINGQVLFRLSQETSDGTIIAERQLTLANIEEMIPAAPRLVDALVHRKPIDATVDMESVTKPETHELRKMAGPFIGGFGILVPGTGIAGAGYRMGWFYQTPAYAMGADYEFALGGERSGPFLFDGLDLFNSVAIKGRYFLNKRNISPYVGGGLALLVLINSRYEYGGLSTYGVVGIETRHLPQVRANLELRIDRPFTEPASPYPYIMPITFGITLYSNRTCCLF